MKNRSLFTTSIALLALILVGCTAVSSADQVQTDNTVESVSVSPATEIPATDTPKAITKPQQPVPQLEIPVPENELAEGDYHWSQLLSRDAIFPVYEPEFSPADTAPYDDDELVIGVEINGEAKAYAIGPLNGREMVNDTVGGVPILVTW